MPIGFRLEQCIPALCQGLVLKNAFNLTLTESSRPLDSSKLLVQNAFKRSISFRVRINGFISLTCYPIRWS